MIDRRRPSATSHAGPERADTVRLTGSSDGLGWDGLAVRTYDEPMVAEQWLSPETPALTLVLISGNTMEMEQRRLNGRWRGFRLHPDDLLLRPPGRAPYELRWSVGAPAPLQTIHVDLQPDLIERTALAMDIDPARCSIRERVGFQDPLLSQIARQLAASLASATPADALYAETAAQLLIAHILRDRAPSRSAAHPAGLTPQQVRRVADFVQAHLNQTLTLACIAGVVGYSPYHFARMFRHATGESPYQFVLRQRVARAEALLGAGTMPLADVALSCGFANQSHLTRVFRSQRGLTPQHYRRLRSGQR